MDGLPINILKKSPFESHAWAVAFGCLFPDEYIEKNEKLKQNILCPFTFKTHHPFDTNSDLLQSKILEWSFEYNIQLYSCGYIKETRHSGDELTKQSHTHFWQTTDEETAMFITLTWNGRI
ncbi:MAG: hypothetical protein HC836_35650 [Richelia sp. RM2_1_2]|nr:hypothetical protein [Richelia sp. RM2_1_2]